MMNCQDIELLLTEHAAGMLETSLEASIEEHLASCTSCRNELAREKVLAETLGQLPVVNTTGHIGFEYHRTHNKWWLPTSGGLVAAAILLAILITAKPKIYDTPAPSPQELATATEDVKWTLNLAQRIIRKNEKEALVDIFGIKLHSAISGSIFLKGNSENGTNSDTDRSPKQART